MAKQEVKTVGVFTYLSIKLCRYLRTLGAQLSELFDVSSNVGYTTKVSQFSVGNNSSNIAIHRNGYSYKRTGDKVTVNGQEIKPGTPGYANIVRKFEEDMTQFSRDMEKMTVDIGSAFE